MNFGLRVAEIIDLGAFEDLTQKGTGKAKDSSEGTGSKV